jgi:hypothetical protein
MAKLTNWTRRLVKKVSLLTKSASGRSRIVLVPGVERRGVATLIEIGRIVPLDLRPCPTFSGAWIVVGSLR